MFTLPPDSRLQHFCSKTCTEGTPHNFIAKSFLGFLGGLVLTHIIFTFFVLQLNFSIVGATLWCSVIGLILTMGLAFSHTVRATVLLLLPQLFSKHGRRALIAYAFVLALTGPTKNTLHNIQTLSESLACAQEKLKEAVEEIRDAIMKPFVTIKEAFRKVMKTIKTTIKKIKAAMGVVKRLTHSILQVMKSVSKWLGNIVNICNKDMGTPYQRCMRVFHDAVADCKANLGPVFRWLCVIAYIPSKVCYSVKILDFICVFVDFINENVVQVVKNKMHTFLANIHDAFSVSVEFKHSFHFETNQSVTMKDIAAGMVTEIQERTNKFLTFFDWMSFAFSLFFLIMIFKVIRYRLKFLKNDRFDNRFITADFRKIDLQRVKNDQETVLPLNRREDKMYITVQSVRLMASEKMKLTKSAVFLGITTFKLIIHMMIDYSLYWVLTIIRKHGSVQTSVEGSNMVGIHVQGEGMLADLYRSVVNVFEPIGAKMEIDTTPCLPNGIPPDTRCYIQIVTVISLCWLLVFLEPYGLRLQHVVMCYYHPDRARQRSVWLYNHILRSRGSFLKYARRQLRRKYGKGNDGITEEVGLMDRLRAQFHFLNIILGKSSQKMCIVCGKVFKEGDKEELIKCQTPNCSGLYCLSCYAEIMNICTICKEPTEYGDLSDVSLERDSSDDDSLNPQLGLRERKSKHTLMKAISNRKRLNDDELGLLHADAIENNNISSSSSEHSYSYQYDVDKDHNAGKPPLETQHSIRDVEAQQIFEPVSTQVFNESDSDKDDEISQDKKV
ncbi:DC-STAMP domain-containing protein 2-like isoform X2 [Zootermopsis nevadensis]|nr:DC-STAMP domain-containing protein 2-like isoform X2 [Zootermopsis nevadensis]XP_021923471.1 DC-STAMP domain-containing protein 2-like isoform X2 [Zootermopsis nevadensis]XP_021923472.1 DC-STAMP domain-containing protein 2-like isoform X2 [Zootermopsis nevadensis]XP_021923473.1 DC-STAMP domain-containing protein 2-like isoform X2 [Zootermopsis nevadensis]XP_021923474.1 DC-STAMP domain-containing protein 2-like isoform X2 [Zootermopsis nevadensis]XP_021923475.1 DC-STAMP domain-containing pro